MNIEKILNELRREREQVGETLLILERLARSTKRTRGRPPAWIAKAGKRERPPETKKIDARRSPAQD